MDSSHRRQSEFRSWIDLNHEAAELIQRTSYVEAEVRLSSALAQLEEYVARDSDSPMDMAMIDESDDDEDESLRTTEFRAVDAKCPDAIKSLEDLGAFVLYDKLFLVPSETSGTSPPSTKNLSTDVYRFWYSAVLYNLGLCCHLLGLNSGMDLHFTRAAYAYDSAISTLENCHGVNKLWLELALLNNSAHISSNNFLNLDSLRSCVFYMTQNLNCLKHLEQEARKRLIDLPTVHFFTHNIQNAGTFRHAPQA